MRVLVTGGAGYIGSHTCVELLNAGYQVVVVDNLSNSKFESLLRVQEVTGKNLEFYQVGLLDREGREAVFAGTAVEAVVHFAGLKAVGESVAQPLRYYHNNVTGTLVLCALMAKYGVKDLVFSSSCTVYGEPRKVPITEDFPLAATNPYGRSKLMIEEILRDLHAADPDGIPNNLLPYIAQVAVGRLAELKVFGDDYPTPDGTGVRDYLHVVDLAAGHIKALQALKKNPGVTAYNLGTGRGFSVLEMVAAFERLCGKPIPYRVVERRPGDVAITYADPSLAQEPLGWSAERGIVEMCADAWRWQSANPNGYE